MGESQPESIIIVSIRLEPAQQCTFTGSRAGSRCLAKSGNSNPIVQPNNAWLPLFIGFAGIAVILRPSPTGLSWWHAAGLVSALTLAISMVATRKLASPEPTLRILFYYVVLSLVCVTPFRVGDFQSLNTLGSGDTIPIKKAGTAALRNVSAMPVGSGIRVE